MKKILDWKKYTEKAVQTVSEGIVMLINKNNALPLDIKEEIAVFGRIQLHYYKSGTGSGGMVNVSEVTGMVDGLRESGGRINEKLYSAYEKGDEKKQFFLHPLLRLIKAPHKDNVPYQTHQDRCLF